MAIVAGSTNSFVTVVEMDAYFANMYNRYSTWAAISDDEEKSMMGITATKIMLYQLDWNIDIDVDAPGDVDSDYLPTIQYACCELVWAIYLEDRQLEPDSKGVLKMKLDVLEIENDKTDRKNVIPNHVLYILRDLITSSAGDNNIPLERE